MARFICVSALFFAFTGGSAAGQQGPDGYSCTATAFGNLGGIDADAAGEVQLLADAAYAPTALRFTYFVRDRRTGWGRMAATWTLTESAPDSFGPIESLRIPFLRGSPPDEPAMITFSLDGTAAATVSAANRIERAADGHIRAIEMRARDGSVPELRGHRLFGYVLANAGGVRVAADDFLLPDWRRQRGAIRSAIREVRALLRARRCDPTYVVGRAT
jgi:hypothetical protein